MNKLEAKNLDIIIADLDKQIKENADNAINRLTNDVELRQFLTGMGENPDEIANRIRKVAEGLCR